ncbi:hypothetical protein HYR69_03440 [Candidatus Sumerlaeota bacterium]|nr:hypothetical protein [Candidatus Sumerlaeota bacterium]MBI3735434.1 hypothetical protein [Candidatus Sumerlaeota bacterium]
MPSGLGCGLSALWHEARGDWDAAHIVVQDDESREAAWVHAYLHRKEGDLGNAAYWYSRAGRRVSSLPFEKEWEEIVQSLLGAK